MQNNEGAHDVLTMDLQLSNKVVLLVGGSKMVGAAIARALASEGAIPVMGGGNADISALDSAVVNSGVINDQIVSPEHCQAAVRKTIEKFATLDALVNNVAIVPNPGLEHQNTEQYEETLQRILLPCYTVTHYALPYLKRAGGSIVNVIAKATGAYPGGKLGDTSVKSAILALTREWAAELAGSGIRVNAVLPSTDTPSVSVEPPKQSPDQPERLKSLLTETGQESGLAAMVVFLLSSHASHITGQHLYVNGDPSASG